MRILIPFLHHIRISHFFEFFAFSHFFEFFAFSHFFEFFAFSHFFLHILRIFLALFTTFWWSIDQKGGKSAKMRKKCDANAKCECDAKIVRCDAMSFYKKCECNAKKFSHYHPCAVCNRLLFRCLWNRLRLVYFLFSIVRRSWISRSGPGNMSVRFEWEP